MLEKIEETKWIDNQETPARLGTIYRSKTNTTRNTNQKIYCFDIIGKKLYQFVLDSYVRRGNDYLRISPEDQAYNLSNEIKSCIIVDTYFPWYISI